MVDSPQAGDSRELPKPPDVQKVSETEERARSAFIDEDWARLAEFIALLDAWDRTLSPASQVRKAA